MTKIQIKDLYAGKPDAKDEINFDGLEDFIKTFVVAENMNIHSLLKGSNCFVTGYKGTGKTALLFYLDELLKQNDASSFSSFIFFKDEFNDVKKAELESMAKRILSSIIIAQDVMVNNNDFEYIWRWLFFKRIVADNEECNNGLFIENDEWFHFSQIMNTIKAPADKRKNIISPKIKLAVPYKDPTTMAELSPEIEIDFQNMNKNDNYGKFVQQIDAAEIAFTKIERTDIPYNIFVDELEAYYGDEAVFKRDLYLIRDLIFTVKRFNNMFSSLKLKDIKIICSVRTEIINAITRFIITKEINKVTSGFEVPLIWDYSNTNSHTHPIVQILLKRIFVCEKSVSFESRDIYQRWFPSKIHDVEPASYILNNSWCKPRDIVRLLIAAQNSIKSTDNSFSQSVFDALYKRYSIDSLNEIKEEMRALYNPEQITCITNCFTGFKTIFSVNQLRERVDKYFPNSIWQLRFNQILQDLYRLGFIGNYLPSSQTYRWQHKGDDGLILSDEWRLMIHYGLRGALSVGAKQDFGLRKTDPLQKGDMVNVTVTKIIKAFVLVIFSYYGTEYTGSIYIGKLGKGYVSNIQDIISIGDEFVAMVLDYNDKYKSWNLSMDYDPPEENN